MAALNSVERGAIIVALCIAVEKCSTLKLSGAIDSFTVGWRRFEIEIILSVEDFHIRHCLPESALIAEENQVRTIGFLLDSLVRELQREQGNKMAKMAEEIANQGSPWVDEY